MQARPFNALLDPPFTYGCGAASKWQARVVSAHPLAADALCAVGRTMADTAEPVALNLADWRQDAFWVAVIAFVFWVVVPNLPVIAGWLP